jgi:hypothetical protein
VLLTGCGRSGQRKRAALGVPAHGPPIAGVDDRAAELADAVECRGQVGDGEVGQGCGVAGARSTLVDSETQAVGVGLPPGSGSGGPWREADTEDSVPEPARAIGIVGGKLDQWDGHWTEYGRRSRLLLLCARSGLGTMHCRRNVYGAAAGRREPASPPLNRVSSRIGEGLKPLTIR